MKTIAQIISLVVFPVIVMATIAHMIPQKVECEVEGQKVECQRPVTVRKEYLEMR